jgi:hypothetical protein
MLERSGAPAVPLGGLGLLAGPYAGRVQARDVSNVSLLVDRRSLRQACRVLGELTYDVTLMPADGELGPLLSHIVEEERPEAPPRLTLLDARRRRIELSWRITPDPPAALDTFKILDRARETSLLGLPFWIPAPEDSIVLSSLRAQERGYAPAGVMATLRDQAAWWERHGERWDLDAVIEHARASGTETPLLVTWLILATFDPTGPVGEGVYELSRVTPREARREAERLREQFGRRFLESSVSERPPEPLEPGAIRRAFDGLMPGKVGPAIGRARHRLGSLLGMSKGRDAA